MDISTDYLLFDFLVSGTYQPLAGSPVSLSHILLFPTGKTQEQGQGFTLPGSMTQFGIWVDELGAVIPEPNAGLTVAGIGYTIQSAELTTANTRYIVTAVKTV